MSIFIKTRIKIKILIDEQYIVETVVVSSTIPHAVTLVKNDPSMTIFGEKAREIVKLLHNNATMKHS